MNFNIPNDQKVIAVALSGGGDSIALAHMASNWAVENNRIVHFLHVNHNLRKESQAEADQIGQWVKNFPNSEYFVLTWDFKEKPDSAVMEKARNARYSLMADHCAKHDIQTLMVAHHADDQLETFLFRLAKGSGLDGLSGMDEWGIFNEISIYRPLLDQTHNDLIQYCESNQLEWIEDPSNQNQKYARPRLRNALSEEGLDAKRCNKTLERLSRSKNALNWLAEKAHAKCVNGNLVDWAVLSGYPIDTVIRVTQKVLERFGQVENNYPPKLERVEEIVSTIRPNKSATLYGCVLTLSKDGNTLEITPFKA